MIGYDCISTLSRGRLSANERPMSQGSGPGFTRGACATFDGSEFEQSHRKMLLSPVTTAQLGGGGAGTARVNASNLIWMTGAQT